jgi:hypothetical protein
MEAGPMSALAYMPLAALLLAGAPVEASPLAAERRPRLEQDECSRRGLECERRCDSLRGADRLSCKTECRMSESRCRSPRR